MGAEGQSAGGGAEMESTLQEPPSESQSEQYSLAKILGVWAAAALPMGALAWVVAPLVAGGLDGPVPLIRTLLALLTVGLIWQFVLVVVLIYRERGSLRWSVLKDALWLHSPRSPKTGRVGGRLWLVVIPFVVLFAAEGAIPILSVIPPVASHDFNVFLGSEAGQAFMSGNWVWFAVYYLHEPWVIPSSLVDIFALSYPSRRYRSALIGIIVHSSQSVFFVP